MIVAHTDSGLGNQMLDYAEYLAIREANPDADVVLETFLYDLPDDRPGMFSKWNGYELEKVFGLKVPLLRDRMEPEAWQRCIGRIEESRFWESGWRYAPVITKALAEEGIVLEDLQKNSSQKLEAEHAYKASKPRQLLRSFFQTAPGYHLKRTMRLAVKDKLIAEENARYDMYRTYPANAFTGHSLEFRFQNTGIERVDRQIREAFVFPDFTDERNPEAMEQISGCNAVAIHARRGDMLSFNGYCYKYGYFRRAVQYIRRHTQDPVFWFFTDPGSMGWVRENESVFGLNFRKDDVRFVTWNGGADSFRDLQLMAACHHNIFTESSFGFWGAYLNPHADKITCAPDPVWLATNSF